MQVIIFIKCLKLLKNTLVQHFLERNILFLDSWRNQIIWITIGHFCLSRWSLEDVAEAFGSFAAEEGVGAATISFSNRQIVSLL